MRLWAGLALALGLAGCVAALPAAQTWPQTPQPAVLAQNLPPASALTNFRAVATRLEPVAEAACRDIGRVRNCDFRIVIDDRPNQPANAFQTLDSAGRPILAFSAALISDALNADELAFVIGHEAAHHILGHIPQAEQQALTGALLAGAIATASGLDRAGIEQAQQMGAAVAARSYSKDFELQADALGAEVAFHAGYDPVKGAAFFDRLPDPGDKFLGSHPANAQRKAVVLRVMAKLTGR